MVDALRKHLPAVVAVMLTLIAGVLAYTGIQATQPTSPVVVASRNLSVGETITNDGISVKLLPPAAAPASGFTSPDQVVGQTVAAAPILEGDAVRAEHVSAQGSLVATLTSFAPAGWVAVELPEGSGSGLAGIRRGDRVHIYTDLAETGTVPVVKDAVVLATPWTTIGGAEASAYVVAIPEKHEQALAEILVHGKRVALVLTKGGE